MTDPGLSDRLRQRSRRAGLMVGVSMALAIVICVGVFAAIYAGLTPWLSDIVPIAAPADNQSVAQTAPRAPQANAPVIAPTSQPAVEVAAEPTATQAPAEPAPTVAPASDAFEPTHQIRAAGESINLRPDPSTSNNPIRALSPATALRFQGDESPSPDGTWMLFQTEDGEEGWVREIDTEPYVP